MQVHLRALGFELTGALRDYVGRRLDAAFGRLADRVRRIEIVLSDENGPRGGVDKQCQVRLVSAGLPAVHVLDRQEDLYVAIDGAMARTAQALLRHKGRRVRRGHRGMGREAFLPAGEG